MNSGAKSAALIVGFIFGWSTNAAFSQTNLIINGSFEAGPAGVEKFTGWDAIGPASENSDYGVAHSSTSPDLAEQGTNYAYFHGHPTDSSQDCLGQSIHLTVGKQYTISYYMATDGPTAESGAAMWVALGTSFGIDYSQDIALPSFLPDSASAMPYQLFTTNITATTADVILSFHGISALSSILLDNVSVTLAVPSMPQLNLSFNSANGLVFEWTSTNSSFLLQSNASLDSTSWGTLTNAPASNGTTNQIVLPTSSGNCFYRLVKQ